jgi:tetratricopeptide (TPR) repeat protein
MELPDERFDGLTLFSETTLNLELRAALYQLCYVNNFVANGPMELCLFNTKVTYLYFAKHYDQDGNRLYQIPDYALPHRGRFPVEAPHQVMVWEDDTYEFISGHFAQLTATLEAEKEEIASFKSKDYYPPSSTSPLVYLDLLASACRVRQVDTIARRLEKENVITADFSMYQRGRARISNHDNSEAIAMLQAAIELNDGDAYYWQSIGVAYIKNGDLDAGIDHLKSALKIAPDKIDLLVSTCMTLHTAGRFDEAEVIARDCLEKGIKHTAIYEILSDICRLNGDLKSAIEFQLAGQTGN